MYDDVKDEEEEREDEEREEPTFIIDSVGHPGLQADFVPLEKDLSDCDESVYDVQNEIGRD